MANQEKSAAELYREERKERLAKAAKKNSKKSHNVVLTKKTRAVIAVLVVIAIIGGIVGFSISNSGVFERKKVAFNVGETEVTMAEYGYYYNSIFSNYFNYSYQYDTYYGQGMGVMYTGYDYSVSPDQQAYSGDVEGVENPKWTDFFEMGAKQSIKEIKATVAYAAENGIALDEKDLKEVEKTIEDITAAAKESNYSLPAYLRAYYGKAMSVELLRKICEEQALVEKVQTVKSEEFAKSYSDKEVEKKYKDDLLTYGTVSLRNYEIKAETVDTPAAEEGAEPTAEVTKATMADAKKKADSFASKVKSVKSFKETAARFEELAGNEEFAQMKKDDSLTLLADATYSEISQVSSDEAFLDWAMDKDTDIGDTFVALNEGEGYTVFMMEAPVHKAPDALTYDVRHILLEFPEEEAEAEQAEDEAAEEATEETTEKTEEKKEEVEVELLDASKYDVTVDIDVDLATTKDKALYKQAQDILVKYLDGDKTEDLFAELAAEHSVDGNAADGGIYEDVPLGQMVPEFENWAIAEDRKEGDVGIVETTYGYHIMYSVGAGAKTTTWSDAIRNDLAAVEYSELAEGLVDGENVRISGEIEENEKAVEEFVVSLAKTQIRNIQANASAAAY